MISYKHRFHGLGSLRYVYSNGISVRSPLMAIKYVRNTRRKHFRCAVVVGKKVSKSAVKRNRMRRRLYEIVRAQQSRIVEPYDIVLTVFSDRLLACPPNELQAQVVRLLREAKITTGPDPES